MANKFSTYMIVSKTSEFFQSCLDALGMPTMISVCRRKEAQIYRYAQDTAHKDETYQNPADLLVNLMERMDQQGRGKHNLELLRVLADSIGCDVVMRDAAVPDKANVPEELLDDLAPLADLHEAIRRKRSLITVKALAGVVKQEVDEDVAAYAQEVKRNEAG
ncbi:hypothetical protein GO013_15670 [Pseudodesulfovibrio sp. JC047]|uniref:hypothetical protein n=1 Tax=Pseudodesulfovibrio sp. JC047 TaxID=2683199 RepID=UPI0013D55612|nr:hypothetical protein [Pseudodesulfovibrio sp. JC047]NDV20849.1 hypothetical protein [Pseudodesulfovibrio sp. JC047]